MDKTYTKGELLQIDMVNGEQFEGYFHSQNEEKTTISLYKARELPKGDICDGVCHFVDSEVFAVTRTKDFDLSKRLDSSLKLGRQECEDLMKTSMKFVFVNQVDNTFHEALEDLQRYSFVAVSADCSDMGRKCKLPVLTLATPHQIYLFDVQVMKYHAFDAGLKQLLEKEHPKKIIHNSRKLSDCLLHKHSVQLKSVFDTQVCDVIITKNKTGILPVKVRSLQECLTHYMGLPSTTINEKMGIYECSKRPLSLSIKESLARNIAYLHRLSEIVNDELMAPFNRGVECFLDYIRTKDDYEAWRLCGKEKQLPEEFRDYVDA